MTHCIVYCICMLITIRSMATLFSSVVRGYFQPLFSFIPWLFHFFLIISGFVHIQRVIYYIKRNIRFHGYSHTISNPMVRYGYILNYDNIAYNQTIWEKYQIHAHMTSCVYEDRGSRGGKFTSTTFLFTKFHIFSSVHWYIGCCECCCIIETIFT